MGQRKRCPEGRAATEAGCKNRDQSLIQTAITVGAVYDRTQCKNMHPRRLEASYKRDPIYYLTLVADERRSLFANRKVHETFIGFGQKARERGVAVGRYVLMPTTCICSQD